MFLASLGILAALSFVLGLVALTVWALKRYGGARMDARSRVAVEVVQRIPFGPKAGMAIVRVGEKVMAVSIGPDGIRPLFELDEADRQRVIATSQVPTPFLSSNNASVAFAKFLPKAMGDAMRARRDVAMPGDALHDVDNAPDQVTMYAPATAAAITPEIPAFVATRNGQPVTYARTVPVPPPADREFRDMLGIAMSGATRLAVLAGLMVLASTSSILRAQGAPPVVPPVSPPSVGNSTGTAVTGGAPATTPVVSPATSPIASPSAPPTALPVVPSIVSPIASPIVTPGASTSTPALNAPAVPNVTAPKAGPPRAAAAPTARQAKVPVAAPARAAKTSTNSGINTSTLDMQLPAAAGAKPGANGRIGAATTAPVAGGDDALARLVPQMDIKLGDDKDGALHLNGTVGIVVMMGLLTLLPTLLLMMTGFTRILIVLHFLKQAMGTQAAPPAQLLAAMALLLTGFVMAPTLTEVNRTAIEPWMAGKMTQVEMLKTGVKPMREFMLRQTRESDIKVFIELSKLPRPNTADDVPLHVLMSAFVASELRTAFQIGFAIYLPFIVIDAVVASVLMSMGMFMLPPAMISLPFKLLLFVLVDGWSLTIQSLVQSFK